MSSTNARNDSNQAWVTNVLHLRPLGFSSTEYETLAALHKGLMSLLTTS
eukprot:CAMPEP_0204314524 /NCGR_PEP_ID=MMETSP0469-20131031/4277_1 /ASSEMBLY_ACC=CAM_ASM_000384 /TAXON_ID=2969 /ORGANISM="Oxyrrhis marina" /LENGTH=48 /DNA_ID= /DNA_START= /DNA_END= /DNA_ORIENTATION=